MRHADYFSSKEQIVTPGAPFVRYLTSLTVELEQSLKVHKTLKSSTEPILCQD